jgi:uncharacterized protein HemX
MEKREMDEQLKSLNFDMDEEIDDRNERRGFKPSPTRHTHMPMDTSQAIILAAIIIVGGLWGGKLVYDYIQEQRIKAALNEAAIYMQQSLKQANHQSRQMQAQMQQRIAAETKAREQRQAQELARRQAELARLAQEKRTESAQCQFWWQQHNQNPTERTAAKKAEMCGRL